MSGNSVGRKQVDVFFIKNAIEKLAESADECLSKKGLGTFTSKHEALGIITEEYHELVEAVHEGATEGLEHELFDLAVACIFTVACMDAGTMDW